MNPDELAPRARLFVFEHFLEHAAPPVLEQVMGTFSLDRDEATGVLRDLEAARHIALVPGTARILMAFPFSAIATPFQATIGGRTYFANCAWDAIAFHSMLGQEIRVDSFCHHCAKPIRIDFSDGRTTLIDPPESIVYLALRPAEWWGDIVATCSNTMVFFASPGHRDASDLCAGADQGASLTPDKVHVLSGPIYAGKFELDYARPTREALLSHWTAMGLTGDYWRL